MKVYVVRFPKDHDRGIEETISDQDPEFGGIVFDMMDEEDGAYLKIFRTRGVKNSLTIRESMGRSLNVILTAPSVIEIRVGPTHERGESL